MSHPKLAIQITDTFPTTTQFAQWQKWADSKIKSYLQCGNTLPTDQGNIMESVADDLLVRKFNYEKLLPKLLSGELLSLSLPELTGPNKMDLDSLKGQDESIEDPAFNFDLDRLEGGFD